MINSAVYGIIIILNHKDIIHSPITRSSSNSFTTLSFIMSNMVNHMSMCNNKNIALTDMF